MNREQMDKLTADAGSISERIRRLHDAGVRKAEIAEFVGRRYQHVYNVIKDHEARRAGGDHLRGGETDAGPVSSLTLGSEGTVRLPSDWLTSEGIAEGDVIICRGDPRGLLLMSRSAAAETLRELARRHMPAEAALLDALIGESGHPV